MKIDNKAARPGAAHFILFAVAALVLLPASGPTVLAADLAGQAAASRERGDYATAGRIYRRLLTEKGVDHALLDQFASVNLEKRVDDFLGLIDREAQKKGDIRIKASQLVALMAAGEEVTLVDIRTEQERAFAVPARGMAIPLPQLARRLSEIPTSGVVVLVCHSGPRAMIGATALRILGRDNVFALDGGIMALADINAKKAPEHLP